VMFGDSSCKLTDYMIIPRYVGTIVEKMFPGPAHSDEGERKIIILGQARVMVELLNLYMIHSYLTFLEL